MRRLILVLLPFILLVSLAYGIECGEGFRKVASMKETNGEIDESCCPENSLTYCVDDDGICKEQGNHNDAWLCNKGDWLYCDKEGRQVGQGKDRYCCVDRIKLKWEPCPDIPKPTCPEGYYGVITGLDTACCPNPDDCAYGINECFNSSDAYGSDLCFNENFYHCDEDTVGESIGGFTCCSNTKWKKDCAPENEAEIQYCPKYRIRSLNIYVDGTKVEDGDACCGESDMCSTGDECRLPGINKNKAWLCAGNNWYYCDLDAVGFQAFSDCCRGILGWDEDCGASDGDKDGVPDDADVCKDTRPGAEVEDEDPTTLGCSCREMPSLSFCTGWKQDDEPSQCFNGKEDSFEDGVDCGGPCRQICGGQCKRVKTTSSKLDVVFVGSGYSMYSKKIGLRLFKEHVDRSINELERVEPFTGRLNYYMVNYFYEPVKDKEESEYFYYDQEDEVMLLNGDAAQGLASQCINADKVIVLANNEFRSFAYYYGYAYISAGSWDHYHDWLVPHEFGHTFGLSDEYSEDEKDYRVPNANSPNCDVEGCPKWSSYIGDSEGTGCFEGCNYNEKGFYRPANDSIMLSSWGNDIKIFNRPSREHLIKEMSKFG